MEISCIFCKKKIKNPTMERVTCGNKKCKKKLTYVICDIKMTLDKKYRKKILEYNRNLYYTNLKARKDEEYSRRKKQNGRTSSYKQN